MVLTIQKLQEDVGRDYFAILYPEFDQTMLRIAKFLINKDSLSMIMSHTGLGQKALIENIRDIARAVRVSDVANLYQAKRFEEDGVQYPFEELSNILRIYFSLPPAKVQSEFDRFSPLGQAVAIEIIRKNNIQQAARNLGVTLEQAQSAFMPVFHDVQSTEREVLLNFFYGDPNPEILRPFEEVFNAPEFKFLGLVLKGMTPAQIQHEMQIDDKACGKIKQRILDELCAESVEGVFARVHGYFLPDSIELKNQCVEYSTGAPCLAY